MLNKIINLLVVLLPWKLKRKVLINFYKYEISDKAKIGLSYVFPNKLILKDNARIDHFNVIIHIDRFCCDESSYIGRNNWFTGHIGNIHFSHKKDRDPSFYLGKHASITKSHIFDCTDKISIGSFTTIAGYRSQFLTHGINYEGAYQDSKPITIGNYCLIGTNVNVIGGATLPDNCILSASSFLNKNINHQFQYHVIGGIPAKPLKSVDNQSKYFNRVDGYIN